MNGTVSNVCMQTLSSLKVKQVFLSVWDSVKHNRYFYNYSFRSCSPGWHREDGGAASPPHPPPAPKILKGEEASEVALAALRRRVETGGQQQRSETAAVVDPRTDLDEELQQEGEAISKK